MKIKEIKALSQQELEKKVYELQKELIKERAVMAQGSQMKSPRKIYQLRKTVARILTVLRQKSGIVYPVNGAKKQEEGTPL